MRAVQFYAFFMHDEHWNLGAVLARVENLEYKSSMVRVSTTSPSPACFSLGNTHGQWFFPPDVEQQWKPAGSLTAEHRSPCVAVASVEQWEAEVSERRLDFEFLFHSSLAKGPWTYCSSSLSLSSSSLKGGLPKVHRKHTFVFRSQHWKKSALAILPNNSI